MKINILNLLFLFTSTFLIAQNRENEIVNKYTSYWYNNPSESAFATTGQKIYYSGNTIKLSLAILDQYLLSSGLSKIAHIELIHESGKFHEEYVVKLENGISSCKINIPFDAPTGNYQLVVYTNFMKNFDINLLYHRLPVYIQNPLEPIQEVVKNIIYQSDHEYLDSYSNQTISVTESESDIIVKLDLEKRGGVEQYFLVSEGLSSLQFIASVKLRSKRELKFKKDQFKGAFQKLILVNGEMEVVSAKPFFLSSMNEGTSWFESEQNQNAFHGTDEVLMTSLICKESSFLEDSIDLFRRFYQLFFKIPPSENLMNLSYQELIANSTLEAYSKYTQHEWNQILSGEIQKESVVEKPEKEIRLSGSVEGNLDDLNECILDIHFFKKKFEMQYPLDTTGIFDLTLIIPGGKDSFFASIINQKGIDVSKKFTISFNIEDPLEYVRTVEMYDKSATDSLINAHMSFNYILNTFNELVKPIKTFSHDLEADLTFFPKDYRGIVDFEEFLSEAIAAVTIVKRDSLRELRLFNKTIHQAFKEAPVIVLNDMIVSGCDLLFDLDLESVETIKLINENSSLAKLGSSFRNGIIIINTKEDVIGLENYKHPNFHEYQTYHVQETTNEVGDKFSNVKFIRLDINADFIKNMKLNRNDCKSFFQTIGKDGSYQFSSKNSNSEKLDVSIHPE